MKKQLQSVASWIGEGQSINIFEVFVTVSVIDGNESSTRPVLNLNQVSGMSTKMYDVFPLPTEPEWNFEGCI